MIRSVSSWRIFSASLLGGALFLAASCGGSKPPAAPDNALGLGRVLASSGGESPFSSQLQDAPQFLGSTDFPAAFVNRSLPPKQTTRTNNRKACGTALPVGMQRGKTALRTIVSGGVKRTYRIHVPAQDTNASPAALVLNFHGRSGTGMDQEITSGLVPLSDREGFVLVSPDGTGTPMGWSAGATPTNSVDDVRLVRDLLDSLTSELCIDSGRVYATGFSNGAFMTSRLACEMPDRITAIAAVGGVSYPSAGCNTQMPILAIHGTADKTVPMEGGTVRAWHYAGARAAMRRWAATNGCELATMDSPTPGGLTVEVFEHCSVPTELLVLNGAGHLWPGAPGTPSAPISGAEVVWQFLSSQRVVTQ